MSSPDPTSAIEKTQWISPGAWAFVAGTFGGFSGVVAGHPFDTLKVRLQSQGGGTAAKYKGTVSAFFQILREEKVRGLYKGMASPLIGVGLVNSMLFGVHGFLLEVQKENAEDESTLQQIFWAGCGSGIANSIVSGPVELAKIRLQNQVESGGRLGSGSYYKGPVDFFRAVYRQGGTRACLRGMMATLLRDTPSYGAYFMSFEFLCRWLTPSGESTASLRSGPLMLAGGLAGIIGWMSTYPLDVVKTLIQGHDPYAKPDKLTLSATQSHAAVDIKEGRASSLASRKHPYNSIWGTLKYVFHSEGTRGLFKGLNATIIRAFPTNAATFLVYSWMTRTYWSHIYIMPDDANV